MNRNTAIAIGMIALLVIGGLVYVVPALLPHDNNVMTVTFYDADDNLVHTESTAPAFWDWAFSNPATGQEISKIVVTVGYDTVITSEGTPTGLIVECDLTYEVRSEETQEGVVINGPHTDHDSSALESDTFQFSYSLSDLIPLTPEGEQAGWSITFEAQLTGSVVIDGDTITATPWVSDTIYAEIGWHETEPTTFTIIDAYVSKSLVV